MIALDMGAAVAFWTMAPIMVISALGMVLSRKAVHSALLLAAVMLGMAVQYAALDAPFLFTVQIIVYTGAILMLFLFVMMLVGVDVDEKFSEVLKGQRWLAALVGIGVLTLLVLGVAKAVVGEPVGLEAVNAAGGDNVRTIAELLFSRYLMHFEITSALLITAALGAMVLAHRDRLKPKATQADLQAERVRRFAATGEHPGAMPNPGVYAVSNNAANPALLPDGTPAPTSVPQALDGRAPAVEPAVLAQVAQRTHDEMAEVQGVELASPQQRKELEK